MPKFIPLGCFSKEPDNMYPITRLNFFIDEEEEIAKQNLPAVDCIDLVARVAGVKKVHILKTERNNEYSNHHISCQGGFTT